MNFEQIWKFIEITVTPNFCNCIICLSKGCFCNVDS